jgi:hypothetical protein
MARPLQYKHSSQYNININTINYPRIVEMIIKIIILIIRKYKWKRNTERISYAEGRV